MVNPIQQLQQDIHLELAKALLEKVKNKEATAAELNVVRQYLKDNNVECNPGSNPAFDALADLAEEVPFPLRIAQSA